MLTRTFFIIWALAICGAVCWSNMLMLDRIAKIPKDDEYLSKDHPDVYISKAPLTAYERSYIWIICLLSPVLGGAILYCGWKKLLPIKAKQANKISIMAFLIFSSAIVVYAVVTN